MKKNMAVLISAFFIFVFLSFESNAAIGPDAPGGSIRWPSSAHVRLPYGAGKLTDTLEKAGCRVKMVRQKKVPGGKGSLISGLTEYPWPESLPAGIL